MHDIEKIIITSISVYINEFITYHGKCEKVKGHSYKLEINHAYNNQTILKSVLKFQILKLKALINFQFFLINNIIAFKT